MSQRRLRVRDLSSSDVQELRENLTNRDGLPRDLAAEAGLLIADLSYLDTCRTALLAAVVRARYQGIHALMASIAGARVKNEAALACCRALVDGKDLERLEQVLDRVDRAAKPRNDLAHGLWTWASWAPGDLLVIRPADFAAHLGAIQATRMAGWALNGSGSLEDRLTVANEHPKDNTPGRGTFDVQRVNPYNLDELRRLRTYAARVQDLLDTMREAFEAAPARANEARKHADQLLQTPSSPFA